MLSAGYKSRLYLLFGSLRHIFLHRKLIYLFYLFFIFFLVLLIVLIILFIFSSLRFKGFCIFMGLPWICNKIINCA